MSKIKPRVLKGFRDYLPTTMIPRQKMLATIEATFQRFAFVPLMTPALELLEILKGKYGAEGESLLYSFEDQGDRQVALRYDLTVPLARVVAQYGELTLPFRRYQIAPVWRAEKPQRGRFREFSQCDGDIVGSADMAADAEILQLACSLLDDLGVANYTIQVNNCKVLSGLMRRIHVDEGVAEAGVLRTIDKLPKIGREKTEELLKNESGLSSEQVAGIFEFLSIEGDTDEKLRKLDGLFVDGGGRQGVDELRQLFRFVRALSLDGLITLDLSIARGLNYYTGTVYEAFLRDLSGIGAVMGGGRYDGLIGVFKGQEVPAVGISLGIDRLLQGLVELKLLEESRSVAQVLVTVFDAESAPHSARIAQDLRRGGVACEFYPGAAKLGKQFRHAERAGMGWVIVLGPDEQAQGKVQVKDLETGAQEAVPEKELVGYLSGRVG